MNIGSQIKFTQVGYILKVFLEFLNKLLAVSANSCKNFSLKLISLQIFLSLIGFSGSALQSSLSQTTTQDPVITTLASLLNELIA